VCSRLTFDRPLVVLFGAAGVLLLIACLNVAGLLAAEATGRWQEIAVRSALGAGRARVARQLLTESALLGLSGALAGLLVAWLATRALLSVAPPMPRLDEVGVSVRVLAFATVVGVITGIVFGLASTLSLIGIRDVLHSREITRGKSASSLHAGVLSLQLAFTVMLLIAAGLFGRSLGQIMSVDPGFTPERLATLAFDVPAPRAEAARAFQQEVVRLAGELPGVTAVSLTSELPFPGGKGSRSFALEPDGPMSQTAMWHRSVLPDYHAMMGIPLLAGRMLSPADGPGAPDVIVVSESFAEQVWPGESPLGKQIYRTGPIGGWTVVGVVGDVRHRTLGAPVEPTIYRTVLQAPARRLYLVARTAADPSGVLFALQRAIWSLDPGTPITELGEMKSSMRNSEAGDRFRAILMWTFAGLAGVLAAVGIFGVTARAVAGRAREIGLRSALGAQRSSIIALVLRESMAGAAFGLVIGLVGAFWTSRLIRSRRAHAVNAAVRRRGYASCISAGSLPGKSARPRVSTRTLRTSALVLLAALVVTVVSALTGRSGITAAAATVALVAGAVSWTGWQRAARQGALYGEVLDAIPHFIGVKDSDGRYRYVNRAAARHVQRDPAEHIGRTAESITTNQNDLEALRQADRDVLESGEAHTITRPLQLRDGSTRWFETYQVGLNGPRRRPSCVLGISIDVTERQNAEADARRRARQNELLLAIYQIAASQDDSREVVQRMAARLQKFFDMWSVGIYLLDEAGRELHLVGLALRSDVPETARQMALTRFGTVPLDLRLPLTTAVREGRLVSQCVDDPDMLPEAREALLEVLATSTTVIPIRAHDEIVGAGAVTMSEHRRLSSEDEVLLDVAMGSVGATVQHVHVLRQQRENQAQLRVLATAIDQIPDAVLLVDPAGIIQLANPAIEHMLGLPADEVVGRPFDFDSADPEFDRRLWEEHRHSGWSGERGFRHRAGHVVPVHVISRPVFDSEGQLRAIAVLCRDITDEKEHQRRLHEAEHMASLGELAAGVAHEVNNPLSAISNFAELLLMQPLSDDVRGDLAAIASEAHRAGSIVRNLLAFARQNSAEKRVVDIGPIVRSVAELKRYQLRAANIEMRLELPEQPTLTLADPNQLQQVLHNLLTNARQAIQHADRHGTVIVRVTASDDAIQLTVDDTGPGIPPDLIPKLFTPFFTTKPVGEGTGLGLSIVYGIVREHGGEVVAENRGRPRAAGGAAGAGGARFTVWLPRTQQPVQQAERPAATFEDVQQLRLRCLIVEDEPLLALSMEKFLARLGYEPHAVLRPEEALQRIMKNEPFDVVLTDLNMPGMSGEEFFGRLREVRPDLVDTVVFTSGDVASRDTHEFLQRAGRPVLAKPYELAELKTVVDRISGEHRHGVRS
jgi:PAS domain S-box-containing protein